MVKNNVYTNVDATSVHETFLEICMKLFYILIVNVR